MLDTTKSLSVHSKNKNYSSLGKRYFVYVQTSAHSWIYVKIEKPSNFWATLLEKKSKITKQRETELTPANIERRMNYRMKKTSKKANVYLSLSPALFLPFLYLRISLSLSLSLSLILSDAFPLYHYNISYIILICFQVILNSFSISLSN